MCDSEGWPAGKLKRPLLRKLGARGSIHPSRRRPFPTPTPQPVTGEVLTSVELPAWLLPVAGPLLI